MAKATADRKSVDTLLKSLLLLSRSVEEVLDTRAVLAACGAPLSPSKVRMLKLISHQGKQTVGQVARFLGVSDPAASQLADAMVHQKLILRNTDPEDRRTAYLKLTSTGQKLVSAIEREQRHRVRQALQSNGSASARNWNEFLRLMCRALTGAEKGLNGACLQCGAHQDDSCVLDGEYAECHYQKRTKRQASKVARKKTARGTGRKGAHRSARRVRAL